MINVCYNNRSIVRTKQTIIANVMILIQLHWWLLNLLMKAQLLMSQNQ